MKVGVAFTGVEAIRAAPPLQLNLTAFADTLCLLRLAQPAAREEVEEPVAGGEKTNVSPTIMVRAVTEARILARVLCSTVVEWKY